MIWELDNLDQIITLLISAAVGGGLCLIYDIMRGIRQGGALRSFWQVFFCDILFWCLSAVTVFLLMLVRTSGVFRSYLAVGLILGFSIFRLVFSRFAVRIIAAVTKRGKVLLLFLSEKYREALKITLKYMKNAEKLIRKWGTDKKTLETEPQDSV